MNSNEPIHQEYLYKNRTVHRNIVRILQVHKGSLMDLQW